MTPAVRTSIQVRKELPPALCYVAVARRDAAGRRHVDDHGPQLRGAGRRSIARFSRCSTRSGRRRSAMLVVEQALIDYGARARGPGLAVVISDFFDSWWAFDGLRYLLYPGLTPASRAGGC